MLYDLKRRNHGSRCFGAPGLAPSSTSSAMGDVQGPPRGRTLRRACKLCCGARLGGDVGDEARERGLAFLYRRCWPHGDHVALSIKQHGNVREAGRGRVLHDGGQMGFVKHGRLRTSNLPNSLRASVTIKRKERAAC